ncbi:hypothetical protein B484DRAFT_458517 [Ochromonadaceae sp. CCMP2298]|nr:hypothetical protein B484DRAFT_458517 [Ochromonadaceae sp. CCMP2298]
MAMPYEYTCGPLKDPVKRANFVASFARMYAEYNNTSQLTIKIVPPTLYRGVKLHDDDKPPDALVAFFTPKVDEAVSYAKYSPNAVYVFRSEGLRVFDMTCRSTILTFQAMFHGLGWPVQFITLFAAQNIAANPGFETDMFNLMHDVIIEHKLELSGFYRVTRSSTLDKNAEEYDIYRSRIPDYIP